jgi:energy-coupling factor transporter ATP-binding protein EcfA2
MATLADPRLHAFLSPDAPEVFHSVEHRHEMWKDDPFDVESLYREAREVFYRLLARATTPPGLDAGRMLLILGESGSGKTHLLRAFRRHVHENGEGYVGYMQMTTATMNYGRYVLSNLIDSLDQPYNELLDPGTSGLMRLARAVASRCVDPSLAALLRDEPSLGQAEVDVIVREAADRLFAKPKYGVLDLDLVRALLYLNRDDARIKSRVLKHLRCEDYPDADREVIGGLAPRRHDDDPFRLIEALGKLVWVLSEKSLLLFVDQLEDIYNLDQAQERFLRAMSTVSALADRVPSSIVVVCCLEDYYQALKGRLTRSLIDRIEKDPEPIRLEGERSAPEVRQLVARRLAHLYEQAGLAAEDGDTYPFSEELLATLTRLRTRDVLDQCRRYRERAVALGAMPSVSGAATATAPIAPPTVAPSPVLELQQAWNDFRAGYDRPRPEEDGAIYELLGWAISVVGDELASGHGFAAESRPDGIAVDVGQDGREAVERLLVRLCNRPTRGGGLTKQLADLKAGAAAAKRTPVVVRTTEFPTSPRTQAAEELGKLIARGGRRAVLEDSVCLTMMALREFRARHQGNFHLGDWLRQDTPLSQLHAMRLILALDQLKPTEGGRAARARDQARADAAIAAAAGTETGTGAPGGPPAAPASSVDPTAATVPAGVSVGAIDGMFHHEVTLAVADLRRHAAFLGMTGSGKTTLVLNLIEELLLRGIPALLVDRKGDLCGYLEEASWTRPLGDPALEARRARLRARLDVRLYTPGSGNGRPLGVPLIPDGIRDLAPADRDDEATLAAQAIGGMLAYRHAGRDKSCRAVLIQAVRLLASISNSVGLDDLIGFIGDEDPALVAAVGRLDTKLFAKLVQDLETFKLSSPRLFVSGAEKLDLEALLGLGPHAVRGRTRLSIVSTKFLGDPASASFWIAQLLLQLGRWASRHPSPDALQAAVLFDEADQYLPATAQPATKQPMENLLRRGRSAGVSLLLATQSPGDLDYKCRDNIGTWFVGKITQQVALNKMKPMLAECRVDVSAKLPGRKPGQFYVVRGGEATAFSARLPAVLPSQLGEAEILALAARGRPRPQP